MQERNELQAWIDAKPMGRGFCIIGKGKTQHLSNMNDETLCGRLMVADGSRYVGVHGTEFPPCAACWKRMQAVVAAETIEGENDTMANTETQDKTTATVEQINANIERSRSLAEAENVEALEELAKETEALISSLPSRGKRPGTDRTWTQYKKDVRADFKAAATVQEKPQPAPKAEVVVLETRDYHDAEGVEELVEMGAQRFAEGVRLHVKSSDLAKDVARMLLDMRVRMTDKTGAPDIKAASHGAKEASKDMYAAAGEMFRKGGEVSEFDAKAALLKLQKSVQNQMPTVRAEYLASLDTDAEEAARFAKILEAAPEGTPASKAVADHYGVELKSRYMLDKERFEAEVGEAASPGAIESGEGEGEGEGEGNGGASEAEQIVTFFTRAEASIDRAEKALGKAKDDESKEAAKARIDALIAHLATLKAGL